MQSDVKLYILLKYLLIIHQYTYVIVNIKWIARVNLNSVVHWWLCTTPPLPSIRFQYGFHHVQRWSKLSIKASCQSVFTHWHCWDPQACLMWLCCGVDHCTWHTDLLTVQDPSWSQLQHRNTWPKLFPLTWIKMTFRLGATLIDPWHQLSRVLP